MISGLTSKILIGAISVAITSIGGLTIYNSTIPSTIGEEFNNSGIKLLPDEDKKWEQLVEKYKSSSENTPKISSLGEETSYTSMTKDSLIEKCKKLWETPLKGKWKKISINCGY